MTTQERLYTADDLLAMPDDGMQHELVQGVIVTMPPSAYRHGKLSFHIARLIDRNSSAFGVGNFTVEGGGYLLFTNPDTVRAPDVGFVLKARLLDYDPGTYCPVAPDLAVELVSPGDTAEEVQAKVNDYLQAGTRLIWVMYQKLRTVVVHTPSGSQTVDINGILDGGDVLPDLKLSVRDIFAILDE